MNRLVTATFETSVETNNHLHEQERPIDGIMKTNSSIVNMENWISELKKKHKTLEMNSAMDKNKRDK